MNHVDLVVTWVDHTDPGWQNTYLQNKGQEQGSYLFRDWGWMRYWFRAAEKNLPWINRIHFITGNLIPEWLNVSHPKLNIIRHADYIPKEYLPTFSSHTVEWNLHRISSLSEQFILCNDDMFFLRPLKEEDYFRYGLPCDILHVRPVTESRSKKFNHLLLNNMVVLNKYFHMQQCAAEHPELWFAETYDSRIKEDNQAALRWPHFPGLYYDHMPVPLLKSSVEALWNNEGPLLDEICRRPFRNFYTDVNIYLARFWHLAQGNFVPYVRPACEYFLVSDPDEQIAQALSQNALVCINDTDKELDFSTKRSSICTLLDLFFPDPSSFEQ